MWRADLVPGRPALRRVLHLLRRRTAVRGLRELASPGPQAFANPGQEHEYEIRAHFRGQVAFTGDHPLIDRPLLILAFTNRSGSNLLADYLVQTGQVAGLGEFLNHETVAKQKGVLAVQSAPDYLLTLARRLSREDQQFGVKASAEQLDFLIRWKLPRLFTRTTVVHIHRDDILGQAVSHWIALQTGQWTSQQDRRKVAADFDVTTTQTIAHNILRSDSAIRMKCGLYCLPYISVSYEELTLDPAATIARIGRVASINLGSWKPADPKIERQATPLNNALKAKMMLKI
ncbi:Stf0 family sulfotransferase [Paracoccus salipaludis]|uniref:Sulphotransferase Stf0 domain-containing protein n=1 Tax=Paracoccus salipaludis TaxID=2032623 RepID=A0A2A2GEX6_9RHOB|nr:Stf0 family sulfotransferase [Paracoccus salipaludis]PAU95477.1 hypothetical protein CK240_16310 [Paracoccus salipaludis]